MKLFQATFRVVEVNNCPLYGDDLIFVLTEKSVSFNDGKESCLILLRELTKILFSLISQKDSPDFTKIYTCSGCTGLIKFQQMEVASTPEDVDSGGGKETPLDEREQKLFNVISNYPLLRQIPVMNLRKFLRCFRGRILGVGEYLFRKNEMNPYLYLILSGELVVEDGPVVLTHLREGALCGEMGYLGGTTAYSSVRAIKNTKLLAIKGTDFSKLVENSPAVQLYMARLLAERLSMANEVRVRNFDSCMRGRINEMAPAELLQIFHMHQKSGVLSMQLPQGDGKITFSEGNIVAASYAGKEDQDAVFQIMKERDGVFHFDLGIDEAARHLAPVGDFMMLLMEGVRLLDEKSSGEGFDEEE